MNKWTNIYEILSASFLGVKKLFAFSYVFVAGAPNKGTGTKAIESIFFQDDEIKTVNLSDMPTLECDEL